MYGRRVRRALAAILLALLTSAVARAQDGDDQTHDMSQMDMSQMSHSTWTFMQDGVFNEIFNRQGGPRGGDEATAVNWWMGMLSRSVGNGQLTLTGMFSLDPATVGTRGYREIFQTGEAIDGRPNVDRQHPHDAFMQLSAAWRAPLSETTTVNVAAAPAGEPALGPVAYMHRASAAAIVFAPLSHHTFDATHISFGVVTAGVARGRWAAEGSVFNGREPDQDRWISIWAGWILSQADSGSARPTSGRLRCLPVAWSSRRNSSAETSFARPRQYRGRARDPTRCRR